MICAGSGVGHDGAGLVCLVLDLEDLQAGAARDEVADVHGVAVAHTGGPQHRAVVVDAMAP